MIRVKNQIIWINDVRAYHLHFQWNSIFFERSQAQWNVLSKCKGGRIYNFSCELLFFLHIFPIPCMKYFINTIYSLGLQSCSTCAFNQKVAHILLEKCLYYPFQGMWNDLLRQ